MTGRTGRPPMYGPKPPCILGCLRDQHADSLCHTCYVRIWRRRARLGEAGDIEAKFEAWQFQREITDDAVVQRLIGGDYAGPTLVGEREDAVLLLWRDRLNDHQISRTTGIPAVTVWRIRQRLGLAAVPAPQPFLAPRRRTRRRRRR